MATTTVKTEENVNYSFGDWKNQNEPRINFVVKIYTILTAQAFLSTFFCLMSLTNPDIYLFQSNNVWLSILLGVVIIITDISAVYYSEPFKEDFYGFIITFFYSLAQAYLISHVCLATNPNFVMMLVFMCFAFIFALMMFYAISRNEFRVVGGLVFSSCVSLLLFFVFMYISENSLPMIALCGLITLIYGIYIIYDTLLILNDKELAIKQSDYVLCSFFYYTDVFTMFASMFQILTFVRELKDDEGKREGEEK